jgi:hypothetical protein
MQHKQVETPVERVAHAAIGVERGIARLVRKAVAQRIGEPAAFLALPECFQH